MESGRICAAGCYIRRDKEIGSDAECGNDGTENPGTLFQHIGGLFHTHQLVAETTKATGETATFGVLNQYDETKYHRGQHNQYHE